MPKVIRFKEKILLATCNNLPVGHLLGDRGTAKIVWDQKFESITAMMLIMLGIQEENSPWKKWWNGGSVPCWLLTVYISQWPRDSNQFTQWKGHCPDETLCKRANNMATSTKATYPIPRESNSWPCFRCPTPTRWQCWSFDQWPLSPESSSHQMSWEFTANVQSGTWLHLYLDCVTWCLTKPFSLEIKSGWYF